MMQLGGLFISNCNNTLHVSDAFCVNPQEHKGNFTFLFTCKNCGPVGCAVM